MKKITPYILIFFIFVNLFAPLSLELSNNKIAINKNKIEAVDEISLKGFITRNDTSITVYAAVNFENQSWRTNNEKVVIILSDSNNKVISLQGPNNTVINATEMEDHPILNATKELLPTEVKTAISDTTTTKFYKKVITGLTSNTTYLVSMYATHTEVSWWTIAATGVGVATIILSAGVGTPLVIAAGTAIAGGAAVVAGETIRITSDANTLVMDPSVSITTNPAGVTQNITANANVTATNKDPSSVPPCKLFSSIVGGGEKDGTPLGCVAQTLYYVLFQPTSYLFALSGTLFDNAFAYSVDDNSYRSPFVVEGWKVVRDFCNMFFIFILLYIAFGTILNLNGVKTKEMIINVVLIGIFINFSLFASQVIIDASNILARVFYNSNTITVKIEDASVGSNVIPLSAALVNKINPQEIILSASQVNTVQDTRGKGGGATDTTADVTTSISTGTFILVTILATIVNVVGIFVFFSISIIFIARVIGLWLAMILVPFAFLSYTVPAMQDFEMVGWKRWWPETIKLAFLAPVFIFFLYLILQFIETGFMIVQNDAKPVGLTLMIGIILPFVFIMILLLKAKSVATKMSGTIGETITKAASSVGKVALGAGGLALGAATGGAAFLARGTIGRLGSSVMNNDKLSAAASKKGIAGFGARTLRNIGGAASKGSFDARSTKLAGLAGKTTGMKFGEAKGKGGFEQKKADQKAKLQKKAKELEVGENSPLKHDLHEKEEAFKILETQNAGELTRLTAKISATQLDADDKNKRAIGLETIAKRDDATEKDKTDAISARQEAVDASDEVKKLKQDKKDVRDNAKAFVSVSKKAATTSDETATKAENDAKLASDELDKITEKGEESVKKAKDTLSQSKIELKNAETATKAASELAMADLSNTKNQEAYKQAQTNEAAAKNNLDTKEKEFTDTSTKSEQDINVVKNKLKTKTTLATTSREKATRLTNAYKNGEKTERSMNELDFEDLPEARQNINEENNERRINVSKRYKSKSNKVLNFISSGGQYSANTANQAAHDVIMDIKSEGGK